MSTTVQSLIQSSMRLIGATTHGRTANSDALADGLAALNQLVDAWGAEKLSCYTSSRTVFNVTSSQQVYTIGPSGADWTAPRPMYIDRAGLLLSGSDVIETPLAILRNQSDWAAIRIKGMTSPISTALYYQPDYPNGQIALWPYPSAS